MPDITLENALEEIARNNENAQNFLDLYRTSREYLEEEVYPWVQSNCPWYTDHGEQHIESVINQASRLLQNELRDPDEGDLNELDIFILLTGILWHDVGMIVDRSEHEDISTEMSERFRDLAFPSTGVKGTVDDIIKAHRKKVGLHIPKKDASFNINGQVYQVYPKSLAGILRFADEISETQQRVSGDTWIRKSVPEESKIFWRYAQSIQACYPDLNGNSICLEIEVMFDKATYKHPCPDPFQDRANNNGEISLIEYIICRLEKMVNELAYCERYFNRYVEIRKINMNITVRDDEDGTPIADTEESLGHTGMESRGSYPNVDVYRSFFDQYSDWKPDQLSGQYTDNNINIQTTQGDTND